MTAEMMPLLREEARKRQATHTAEGYGSKQLQVNSPEAVLKGQTREIAAKAVGVGEAIVQIAANIRDVAPLRTATGPCSCARCDEGEPASEPVPIEAAARAASQILRKEPGTSWGLVIQFAKRLGISPSLELVEALAAGGWSDALNPEAWLRAKLAHNARRARICEARRARRLVMISD